jgi:hypothetical protein
LEGQKPPDYWLHFSEHLAKQQKSGTPAENSCTARSSQGTFAVGIFFGFHHMLRAALTLCCLFTLIGCGDAGPTLAPVTGKVTKAGQPLAGITVTFSPVAPGPSSGGMTDAEGKYTLVCQNGEPGAVVGKHKVVLTAPAAGSAAEGMEAMMKQREGSAGSESQRGRPAEDKSEPPFPPEYGDAQKTKLEFDVGSDTNDFPIEIP